MGHADGLVISLTGNRGLILPARNRDVPTAKLILLTYNIWFDESNQRARFDAMLDEVFPHGADPKTWPDFVALQEVTKLTATWLCEVGASAERSLLVTMICIIASPLFELLMGHLLPNQYASSCYYKTTSTTPTTNNNDYNNNNSACVFHHCTCLSPICPSP